MPPGFRRGEITHMTPKLSLTHVDPAGRAKMVDVGCKDNTERVATARGRVKMKPATLAMIRADAAEKGAVLAVAQIAGIQAAKRTHDLIPLCHPLLLTHVQVDLSPGEAEGQAWIDIEATVRTTGKTGVEMEALTAVAVAGLTVYDMCKAVDRAMRITDIRLEHKSGGKSGTYDAREA
jgi:cyclic pyranopterin phosphate synthase